MPCPLWPPLQVPWIVELSPWAPSDEAPAPGGGLASQGEAPYSGRLEHLCLQVGRSDMRQPRAPSAMPTRPPH